MKLSLKTVLEKEKLLKADYYLEVLFEYPKNNIKSPWTMTSGKTLDFVKFLKIENMKKRDIYANRVLQLIETPEKFVDLTFKPEEASGRTALEVGVLFKELEEGKYDLTYITDGSKNWTDPSLKPYYFSLNPISITLDVAEKEKAKDIESAAKQGESISSAGAILNQGSEAVGVAIALLNPASCSILIKFIQSMKLFTRLKYIGVNFGKILTAFLTTGSEFNKDAAKYNDDLQYYSQKTNNKLSLYNVSLITIEKIHWKFALYLISFLLKGFVKFNVRRMKEADKVDVSMCKVIYFLSKIHFIMVNIWIIDFIFYSIRSILHIKKLDGFGSIMSYLVSHLLLTLLLFDLYHIYSVSNLLKDKSVEFHQINIEKNKEELVKKIKNRQYRKAKVVIKNKKAELIQNPSEVSIGTKGKKGKKSGKNKNQKGEDSVDQSNIQDEEIQNDPDVSTMALKKDNNKNQMEEEDILIARINLNEYTKVVDETKTLSHLHIDKSVFDYVCTELNSTKLAAFSDQVVRHNSSMFLSRIVLFNALLITNQYLPEAQTVSLFLLELCYLVFSILKFIQNRHLKSSRFVLAKTSQSLCLLFFIMISMMFSFDRTSKLRPQSHQYIGIYSMVAWFVLEALFLVLGIVALLVNLYSTIQYKRKLKKMGNNSVEALTLLENNVFYTYVLTNEEKVKDKTKVSTWDKYNKKKRLTQERNEVYSNKMNGGLNSKANDSSTKKKKLQVINEENEASNKSLTNHINQGVQINVGQTLKSENTTGSTGNGKEVNIALDKPVMKSVKPTNSKKAKDGKFDSKNRQESSQNGGGYIKWEKMDDIVLDYRDHGETFKKYK